MAIAQQATPTAAATTTITVNGADYQTPATPDTPLLYVLRNDLGLHAAKFGCGLAQCGSCTVLINGEAVRSCIYPISETVGKQVTTLEGLGTAEAPGALQQAFIDEQAAQCGYCIPGMIMSAAALLNQNPNPDNGAIRQALSGNLCRCGTYLRIQRAVERAAGAAS